MSEATLLSIGGSVLALLGLLTVLGVAPLDNSYVDANEPPVIKPSPASDEPANDDDNADGDDGNPDDPEVYPSGVVAPSIEELGRALFNDTNLSANRTQACATCHDEERAFSDGRLGADGNVLAGSLGDDGFSVGDRNAPALAYVHLTPTFTSGSRERFNSQQSAYQGFMGGFFWDGRAATLASQAKGPPVNPAEMGLIDAFMVSQRLQENPDYIASFRAFFGDDIFDDADQTFEAMGQSIAAYESTAAFASFDSKYDKSLRGEYEYNPLSKAAAGKALFFSQQFTNCATCHQLKANAREGELFTGFGYHNIGVPENESLRALNNVDEDYTDPGLSGNATVGGGDSELGKFRTPTLRNVAVTSPYMHNGVFRDLATVIKFYDHYFDGSRFPINPETGDPWGEPEHAINVARTELLDGRRLTERDIESLVCFLRTLTDQRYEHLIPDDGLNCE